LAAHLRCMGACGLSSTTSAEAMTPYPPLILYSLLGIVSP